MSEIVCCVYILEWLLPSFPMGKKGTFSFFQVTHVFQGKLYKMKVSHLKCPYIFLLSVGPADVGHCLTNFYGLCEINIDHSLLNTLEDLCRCCERADTLNLTEKTSETKSPFQNICINVFFKCCHQPW